MKKSSMTGCVAGLLSLMMIIWGCGSALSADVEIARISIEKLKAMMDAGQQVIILDTQPKAVYDMEHIKGAISFPWEMEINPAKANALPRDQMIITYCDCGPGESDSNDVAVQLKKMGFKNVVVLSDPSVRGWIEKGYPKE